jgi:signal transduction histidine kinase
MTPGVPDTGPGRLGFVAPLWRGVDVFRTASLLYAVVLYSQRFEEYARPLGGWLVLLLMAVWTAVVWFRPTRPAWLQVSDLAASCAAVLATRLADTPERIAAGAQTLPVTWPAASVLAFAVWKGWRGGLVAAAAVGLADIVEVQQPTLGTIHNIVLLVLLGGIVGYCADLYRGSREALSRALRVEAATRERERLARDIHDSVLQVLAYVQRRGAEIGGDAAELGRLAGEQEVALRGLVASRVAEAGGGTVDLRRLVAVHQRAGVQVSAPADPVPLPYDVADQVAAAVAAALDNVRQHAGPGARAWVLVEDEGSDVLVTVRDDGVGMAAGRLDEASASGRLGVAQSVRGRVREVGGSVNVVSAPGAGTEIEMRVPRKVPA